MNGPESKTRARFDVEPRKLSVQLFRWGLPASSGALLAVSFPPFNLNQAAWLALLPLLFALDEERDSASQPRGLNRGEAFRRGYVAGLVFFGMSVWWTIHVTVAGTVALIAFLALYIGAAAVLWAMLNSLFGKGTRPDAAWRNLAVALLAAAGWATIEWVRGWFLFGGFPWNFLGVSQHRAVPLIQFAGVTGVYGVSALVVFVNVTFYFTVRRFVQQARGRARLWRLSWEFYAAMILVCAAFLHGVGVVRRGLAGPRPRALRLALVQGNVPQTLKFEPEQKPMILNRYRRLTEMALGGRPGLIIWPETATPEPVRYDIESYSLVTNLAAKAGAPLLTGTIDATPFAVRPEYFNAAVLVRPDGTIPAIYRKLHLVPFGEYVPLRKLLPFMKRLTPIQESLERGTQYTVFEVPPFRFAAVICFEDTVPGLYRRFVRRGVDFMVNLTNDAWFKESPAAAQHLANAAFRAAETRRPLVRATNNGVTCVLDEFGFVRARLEPFTEGSLHYELSLPEEFPTTFYTVHGDVFVAVCAALSVGAVLWFAAGRRFRLKSAA